MIMSAANGRRRAWLRAGALAPGIAPGCKDHRRGGRMRDGGRRDFAGRFRRQRRRRGGGTAGIVPMHDNRPHDPLLASAQCDGAGRRVEGGSGQPARREARMTERRHQRARKRDQQGGDEPPFQRCARLSCARHHSDGMLTHRAAMVQSHSKAGDRLSSARRRASHPRSLCQPTLATTSLRLSRMHKFR